jgi:hypothetical protein
LNGLKFVGNAPQFRHDPPGIGTWNERALRVQPATEFNASR